MRPAHLLLGTTLLAAACGGSTFSTGSGPDGGGSAGSGATGGSAGTGAGGGSGGAGGSGGSAAAGGSSGTGATSGSGGSGATGGSAGTSGAGGSSGGGGSGGNPDWYACGDASQCTLFAENCCGGYCGTSTIDQWTAINGAHENDYQSAMCASPQACPGCMTSPTPDFAAVCRLGRCVAIDVRTDPLSKCQTSLDCELRWGAGCCQLCDGSNPENVIAVNKNVDFNHAVCGNSQPPCCAPPPIPPDAVAECMNGHCAVSFLVGG